MDQCRNVLNIEKCPLDPYILRAQIVLSIKDQTHLHGFISTSVDEWIAENLPKGKYVDHLCLHLLCNYLEVKIRTIHVSTYTNNTHCLRLIPTYFRCMKLMEKSLPAQRTSWVMCWMQKMEHQICCTTLKNVLKRVCRQIDNIAVWNVHVIFASIGHYQSVRSKTTNSCDDSNACKSGFFLVKLQYYQNFWGQGCSLQRQNGTHKIFLVKVLGSKLYRPETIA